MQIDAVKHLEQPWRVHALAHDFELLDVWRFPLTGGSDELAAFVALMRQPASAGSTVPSTSSRATRRPTAGASVTAECITAR